MLGPLLVAGMFDAGEILSILFGVETVTKAPVKRTLKMEFSVPTVRPGLPSKGSQSRRGHQLLCMFHPAARRHHPSPRSDSNGPGPGRRASR